MLRRNARLRKEYLFRKSVEDKDQAIAERKRKLRDSIESGKPVPTEWREDLKRLRTTLDLDDAQTSQSTKMAVDDEYYFAGTKDPKILVTTSRSPTSRLSQFVKELNILLPNANRVNRGGYQIKDLVNLGQRNEISDIIVVHEQKGEPDGLIISHMPHGPTAYFSLLDVVLRHDLPEKLGSMSECAPHMIFHNFSSKLGERVQNILKFLFPPPNPTSERVVAFVNYGDMVLFRNYTSKAKIAAKSEKPREQDIELTEQGPRFTLKLYRIDLGTLDMKDVQTEWSLKAFINKPKAALS